MTWPASASRWPEPWSHAHGRGVIHRDVKPQNVIVPDEPEGAAGVAKLTDFGVAHLVGDEPLTRTGDVVGTLAYMAPEQAEGRRAGPAADLYALALVLYEALAGSHPVRGRGPAATARRLGAVLPSLGRSRRDLPAGLVAAVDRALRARPRRPRDPGRSARAPSEALRRRPQRRGRDPARRAVPLGAPGCAGPQRLRAAAGTGALAAAAAVAAPDVPGGPAVAAAAAALAALVLPRAGVAGGRRRSWSAGWPLGPQARPGLALVAGRGGGRGPAAGCSRARAACGRCPRWRRCWAWPPLAGAFPALAGQARTRRAPRRRWGRLGAMVVALAEPLAARRCTTARRRAGAPEARPGRSLRDSGRRRALAGARRRSPRSPPSGRWPPRVLPWLLRGRSLAADAARRGGVDRRPGHGARGDSVRSRAGRGRWARWPARCSRSPGAGSHRPQGRPHLASAARLDPGSRRWTGRVRAAP